MIDDSIPSARLAPPVGGFHEVDGRRLFLHRSGSGGPAVVFLPGASAVGLDYFGVQREVSRFTTAMVYDRGGTGYSDTLPLPRTAAAVATELRDLLRGLEIPAPHVLAAHSLGGFYAHRFAQLFPDEVAGLVWLDALHRDWDAVMPDAASLAAIERMSPDARRLERMRPALRAMREELLADYPDPLRRALVEAKDTERWLRSGVAERGSAADLAAETADGPGIPDVPVIAVTVTGIDPALDAETARAMVAGKTRLDAALAASVSRGEHRVLPDTFHHRLCFDRPDAVVAAIRDVVDRARTT